MSTLEASLIMPVIIMITIFILLKSMDLYDSTVIPNCEYGLLTNQLSLLYPEYDNSCKEYSVNDISSMVHSISILSEKPAYNADFSGHILFLENNKKPSSKVYVENINNCEILRKESALLSQSINK